MALDRYRFVAEITLAVDADGTEQTFYFGTSGFSTTPSDTPANTVISARLANAGMIRRELFSGARVAGAVRPSFGELEVLNNDGALDAWIGYGVSGGLVTVRYGAEGGAYPSSYTTVYVARIFSMRCDFDLVRLTLRDRLALLDRPVLTATFLGTGDDEATTPGRFKQLLIGQPGYTPLIPVDTVKQIYFVQGNAASNDLFTGVADPLLFVYDFGNKLTHGGAVFTKGSFFNWAGQAGTFTVWAPTVEGAVAPSTTGPVYIRLGHEARGEMRFTGNGLLKNSDTDALRPWRITDMANRAGLTDITPTSLAAGSVNVTLGNRLVDDDQTFLYLLNDVAKAELLSYGFTRLDEFYVRRLKDPADTSDAADVVRYRFTAHNSAQFRRLPIVDMEAPVYQVTVNAGLTWPCAVDPLAEQIHRDELTRQGYYSVFTGTAESVLTAHPGALSDSVTIDGRYFTSPADQQAFAEAYLGLYGGRRDYFELTCLEFTAETIALDLHDKVELELDRFGCNPAQTFRIVTIQTDLRLRTIRFGIWGGDPGPTDIGTVTVGGGGGGSGGGGSGGGGGGGDTGGGGSSGDTGVAGGDSAVLPALGHAFYGRISVAGVSGSTAALPACGHTFAATQGGGDPLFSSTIWLLHCEDTEFVDYSAAGRADAGKSGNAQTSSGRAKAGTKSGLLDGVGDYISSATTETFTGDFCFEGYFYINASTGAHQNLIALYDSSTSSERWSVYRVNGTNKLALYRAGTGDLITGTTTVSTGQWYHVAWSRISGTHRIALDGNIEGSYSHSGTLAPDGIAIGVWVNGGLGPTEYLDGNFDEIRVTLGDGRGYSTNFTPPAVPFADG